MNLMPMLSEVSMKWIKVQFLQEGSKELQRNDDLHGFSSLWEYYQRKLWFYDVDQIHCSQQARSWCLKRRLRMDITFLAICILLWIILWKIPKKIVVFHFLHQVSAEFLHFSYPYYLVYSCQYKQLTFSRNTIYPWQLLLSLQISLLL